MIEIQNFHDNLRLKEGITDQQQKNEVQLMLSFRGFGWLLKGAEKARERIGQS